METKQSQIKINLSQNLKKMMEKRADKYGLSLAAFTKYLFIRDLEESEDLDFSKETWAKIKKTKSGKIKWLRTKSVKELDKMVDGVKL